MRFWPPIAGETPIDDVSGLLPKGIATQDQLNVAEAENIRAAVVRYLGARPSARQAPFTLAWLYKLHAQMFGDVWMWAGKRRVTELNIGVPYLNIDIQLQQMLDDLAWWHPSGAMPLVEQAARLSHRAVAIHPFLNGNGRWSRLLANIWLKRNRHPITAWPDVEVGAEGRIRDAYLVAIRAADLGNFDPLIKMHALYADVS